MGVVEVVGGCLLLLFFIFYFYFFFHSIPSVRLFLNCFLFPCRIIRVFFSFGVFFVLLFVGSTFAVLGVVFLLAFAS